MTINSWRDFWDLRTKVKFVKIVTPLTLIDFKFSNLKYFQIEKEIMTYACYMEIAFWILTHYHRVLNSVSPCWTIFPVFDVWSTNSDGCHSYQDFYFKEIRENWKNRMSLYTLQEHQTVLTNATVSSNFDIVTLSWRSMRISFFTPKFMLHRNPISVKISGKYLYRKI